MPFLMKYHAVGVFQCYLPESIQSIETLVELRPEIQHVYGCLPNMCLHLCVYIFVSYMCLSQRVYVFMFVCVSVCFSGGYANTHCGLNDMVMLHLAGLWDYALSVA